jgi:signal peptidase II
MGGAIGNFIDRLHLAYVIDFIDWYVGRTHWPTFNFADAAITSGVGLLIVDMFAQPEKTRVSNHD